MSSILLQKNIIQFIHGDIVHLSALTGQVIFLKCYPLLRHERITKEAILE